MKTKRYIAYFLFFISMIMLTVPVIPHHHHEDGIRDAQESRGLGDVYKRQLLTLPDETGIRQEFVYLESLHGTFITRATGLRAPPSVLA